MKKYQQLLLQNRAWVEQKLQEDKDFFNKLSKIQNQNFYGLAVPIAACPPMK